MSDLTDNAQVAELKRRAEREAANVIARFDLAIPGATHSMLVSAIALGWLEGRQTGLEESREIMRGNLAAAGSGLHSVKVTPRRVTRYCFECERERPFTESKCDCCAAPLEQEAEAR